MEDLFLTKELLVNEGVSLEQENTEVIHKVNDCALSCMRTMGRIAARLLSVWLAPAT